MTSEIEMARSAAKTPIQEVGAAPGISAEHLVPFGHDRAKVSAGFIAGLAPTDSLADTPSAGK